MKATISEFIRSRIEDITQELHQNNAAYALANAACTELLDTIQPIIQSQNSITISVGDCYAFRTYFEQDLTQKAILEEALYRQGCRDCIRLLSELAN